MKLREDPALPYDMPNLVRQLRQLWAELSAQVNGLSEGSVYAAYTAATAPPTTGTWA